MQAARKFDAFCLDPTERAIFVGDFAGRIMRVEVDSFEIKQTVQAHAGTVTAVAASPTLPYLVSCAIDQTIAIFRYDKNWNLTLLAQGAIRGLLPDGEEPEKGDTLPYSQSQCLGFHRTERRIVMRGSTSGVAEADFDDAGGIKIRGCYRLHDHFDPIFACYVGETNRIISTDVAGNIVLSENGVQLRSWQVGGLTVHWLDHVEGNEYLLSSDARLVARLDIEKDDLVSIGSAFARDDLEQVSYNKASKKAYVSSFDRNIYEVDPITCEKVGVTYRAPYKCRWLKSSNREPSVMFVNCRDGSFHKVNAVTGKCIAALRMTPPALWTGLALEDGSLLFAGEGDRLLRMQPDGVDDYTLARRYRSQAIRMPVADTGYTKRMVRQESTGRMVLGHTSGCIYIQDGEKTEVLCELSSAIRDLAVWEDSSDLFVACEDGRLMKVDLDSGVVRATFTSATDLPIWALACNPQKGVVAACERWGKVIMLAADDLSVIRDNFEAGRAKRAKWTDEDHLWWSNGAGLHQITLSTGVQEQIIENQGNTVEDFVWDPGGNYLLLVVYTGVLALYDFRSLGRLGEIRDQIDYSKGVMWIPSDERVGSYPLDFVTFGRSGTAHGFRVHNDSLVALGPMEGLR